MSAWKRRHTLGLSVLLVVVCGVAISARAALGSGGPAQQGAVAAATSSSSPQASHRKKKPAPKCKTVRITVKQRVGPKGSKRTRKVHKYVLVCRGKRVPSKCRKVRITVKERVGPKGSKRTRKVKRRVVVCHRIKPKPPAKKPAPGGPGAPAPGGPGTGGTGGPSIAGSMIVGQVLTALDGTWASGATGYTYQWYDESAPIAGATNSTYALTAADADHTIDVGVTAYNGSKLIGSAASPSTAVVVMPCNFVDSSASQIVTDLENPAHSGMTVCARAGSYSITSLNVHQGAMTTLEAYPGDPQPTLTASSIGTSANNLRVEGFQLNGGFASNGVGTLKIVNNYYHDKSGGEALFLAGVNDTAGTVTLAHNRMVNVTTNDPSNFSLGWGAYGCDTSKQTMDLFYNTFNTMNQHPAQLADCGAINIVGNEFTNIYYQYSAQHVDCIEVWGQAGPTLIKDNRCMDSASNPGQEQGMLLSGDSGPYTVVNNLIVGTADQCFDDTPNGTYNGSMSNSVIENNTLARCSYGGIDMDGGNSTGNTVEYNVAPALEDNGSCSQFAVEDNNDLKGQSCPGKHDTAITPKFADTVNYQTTNINPAWGYHPARVGYDSHMP
jgi:hypothetical protein